MTGSKHHLIRDGRGTPLQAITTAENVNDVTQTPALADGTLIPRKGRPHINDAFNSPACGLIRYGNLKKTHS